MPDNVKTAGFHADDAMHLTTPHPNGALVGDNGILCWSLGLLCSPGTVGCGAHNDLVVHYAVHHFNLREGTYTVLRI